MRPNVNQSINQSIIYLPTLSSKACFKRRATAVLSWLDYSSTVCSTTLFQTLNLIRSNRTAVAENKTQ